MSTGAIWDPRTQADAFRQGRPVQRTTADRLADWVGLTALTSRRARKMWRRAMPYVLVGAIGAAALVVAAAKALR